MSDLAVLILAGQRAGVVDPLCAQAGLSHKADLPILGKPMLNYVTEALKSSGLKPPYFVSGYSVPRDDLRPTQTGDGPADSVMLALEEIGQFPCLITTCDHALLEPAMVQSFLDGARASGADICVGLADKRVIAPAYPETKRTYLKFSDRAVSGCNLFYVRSDAGLKAIDFWRDVQHLRKSPMKLARKIGLGVGFRYALGYLTLEGAFAYLAKRVGVSAAPVLIPIAEAAIDVDKPADLDLVISILNRRGSK